MSVQRWAPFEPMALMGRHPDGAFVRYADHARIVAEAEQRGRDGVFRIFNSDPKAHSITNEKHVMFCAECHAIRHVYEQGKADAEQAHAAALAAVERLPGHTAHAYIETSDWSGGQSAQVRFQQSEQGRWVDKGDVLTLLGNAAAAPRTLTAAVTDAAPQDEEEDG